MPASTYEVVEAAYIKLGGDNVAAIQRETGLARGTVRFHMKKLLIEKPLVAGSINSREMIVNKLPKGDEIARYILTSAQSNTHLFEPFWENLTAMSEHLDATMYVASYSYNIHAYGKKAVKRGTHTPKRYGFDPDRSLWYDHRVEPYFDQSDERIQLAPGLIWCGEHNTLPTAARPLTGLEGHTGANSAIYPHAKMAMQSVPTSHKDHCKFLYTTGTVTTRNYIQKRAGLLAEHHHVYGALLVEVNSDGDWGCRQLNGGEDGTIYDLDMKIAGGRVINGVPVGVITWGDIHALMIDENIKDASWEPGGMLDTLRPRYQTIHDLVDFRARNHHDRGNPHRMFKRFITGMFNVEDEMQDASDFLHYADRDWCQTIVVNSNHDNAFLRWLREADYKSDPTNAIYFLEAQLAAYNAIKARDSNWLTTEWAMHRAKAPDGVTYLREDESWVHLGIEHGMHGDLGPNGARGTPMNLSKMGLKGNSAHTHSAAIVDGQYVAGTSSKLDMEFNTGPSSWSHSHIVTYENGKRAIITMKHGQWRAEL